jgi:AcrR family transcriptional regulator
MLTYRSQMKQAPAPFYVATDASAGKRKILTSALKLFVRDGLCETSIRDIATASGLTNPALFKHFASKDALAAYLFETCYLELYRLVRQAIESEDGFDLQHHVAIVAFVMALEKEPDAVIYVQDNLRQFWPKMSVENREYSILGLVRKLLESGKREGAVTSEIDIQLLITAWLGTLQQLARARYFGEVNTSTEAMVSDVERLLRRLVAA